MSLIKFNLSKFTNLIFFFFFKIFNALFSKLLATITSKKILFNLIANFLVTRELIATTPPKALIGSQLNAFSNDKS